MRLLSSAAGKWQLAMAVQNLGGTLAQNEVFLRLYKKYQQIGHLISLVLGGIRDRFFKVEDPLPISG